MDQLNDFNENVILKNRYLNKVKEVFGAEGKGWEDWANILMLFLAFYFILMAFYFFKRELDYKKITEKINKRRQKKMQDQPFI